MISTVYVLKIKLKSKAIPVEDMEVLRALTG
jgi:hypothetical protein